MLKTAIQQLMKKKDLTPAQCQEAITDILNGANPEQTAAFLVLLHTKTETADELYGIVRAMQTHMIPINYPQPLIDIVGTGGDGANTVNISTASGLLVASCGVKVAKHGNRAISSTCGSADVLEALGIPIDHQVDQAVAALNDVGFAFLFAPNFHPAMKTIKDVRTALGVRTTFNLIGPLLNPAQPAYYLMGVANENLLETFADVLHQLNTKRAFVVHGNGLDEINCLGPNKVIEITPKGKKHLTIDPKDYGFQYCQLNDLCGGDAQKNKQRITQVFQGKPSALADTIILNAAVALMISGFCTTIEEGIHAAKTQLANGQALQYLERCKNKGAPQEAHHA